MPSLFPGSGSLQLPLSKTYLIKGPYHASAPIHFCLSYLAENPHSRALVLSPCRKDLLDTLQEYNDDWLATYSGNGRTSDLSSKITIFYPPSPAHTAFLLSMFRTSTPSDGASFNAKTTFEIAPSLIVMHEISSYFRAPDPDAEQVSLYTVSSYLSLITHALASLSYLCGNEHRASSECSPSLVLFDSGLDQLRLPVIRPAESPDPPPRTESVAPLAQKYFEWVGTFEHVSADSEEDHEGTGIERSMRLLQRSGQGEEVSLYRWFERHELPRRESDRRGTTFVWS